MQFSIHPISRAVSMFLLSAATASALAQSAAPTESNETVLPAVVVTSGAGSAAAPAAADGYNARRSETALGLNLTRRETPQSISVITRQQIEDFGLYNVNDLLNQATGITVERVETDRTYYTARGFDVTNFQFDGIGMPFTNGSQWGDIDTALFERVDVLRGANGLLSSTGNPSATVNFVSKRPTRDLQASAALTLGSWNNRRLEGDVSGALNASGSARGRLIVVSENKDSYLDRYSTDKAVVSGTVDFDLTSSTLLSVGYSEQRKDANSPMWGALPLYYTDGTPTDYDASTSTAADWAYWNNRDRRAHADLVQELGGEWQLKASLMQRTMTSDSQLFYVYGTPDKASGTGLFSYPSAFKGDYTQSLADVRASGPFTLTGRRHELMAGVNWAREKAREHSDYGQGIGSPVPDLTTWDGNYPKPSFDAGEDGSHFDTYRRSAYAASHLNVADGFKLILGANATTVSSSGENYGVAHAYDRSAVTPYVGAVADLSPNVSAYGSYTRIFKPQTEVDVNNHVLDPIQGRNVEAGLKSEWLDKKLAASLAVFRTRQENTAQVAGSFANFQSYYEGVDATSTGFEAELTGRLTPNWNINSGYTQLTLKDDEGQDARTFVPRRTLRVATDYRVIPALKVGAALRYQSDISTLDGTTLIQQEAYTVLDLMARFELSRQLSLSLNLNNVTDKKYLTSLYWTQAYYGAPRNVSANLRWTY